MVCNRNSFIVTSESKSVWVICIQPVKRQEDKFRGVLLNYNRPNSKVKSKSREFVKVRNSLRHVDATNR